MKNYTKLTFHQTIDQMPLHAKTTIDEKIIAYFEEAGLDYYYWDKAFNMHFGYFKRGINPLNRPQLLRQMNDEIMEGLHLDQYDDPLVLDLGCGLGAISRHMAHHFPNAQFQGYTITPWQVRFGNQWNQEKDFDNRIRLIEADFAQLPLADGAADAAFASESACYAKKPNKVDFIEELYRVLKPGGRFVVTDGFRQHSNPLPTWLHRIYRKNMDCWALTNLADIQQFKRSLQDVGFHEVIIKDISWRVAPSFMHIPWVSAWFLFDVWRKGKLGRLPQARKNNVMAPLLGMIMGLHRQHFGYYIISGIKR